MAKETASLSELADTLRLAPSSDDAPGLRLPQLAAVHSVSAHFYAKSGPAIVVMPTGTGKSIVAATTAIAIRSSRLLLVVPNRVLREQMGKLFKGSKLQKLKELNIIPEDSLPPNVEVLDSRIQDAAGWEVLREFDVVITTPHVASPHYKKVEDPPAELRDLFDLIIVDEGHHSVATTWAALIDAFPNARCMLLTATPFRGDGVLLPGEIVFHHRLRDAMERGHYAPVSFVEVQPEPGDSTDVAIAKRAEELLTEDRENGFKHLVLARAKNKGAARNLVDIYDKHTNLKMVEIHSGRTAKQIRDRFELIEKLEVDGVISVDMFGEGVDVPRFKIAAMHEPYKSVAPTLQFIGRLSRTNADDIGPARFVGIRQLTSGAVGQLFEEDAAWAELVPDLADMAVEEEKAKREFFLGLKTKYVEGGTNPVSVAALRPFFHIRAYSAIGFQISDDEPDFGDVQGLVDVVDIWTSEKLNLIVYQLSIWKTPKWSRTRAVYDVENVLIAVRGFPKKKLLFVNSSSTSSDTIYAAICDHLCNSCALLPTSVVERAMNSIKNASAFNVGLRDRVGNRDVSYRINTGSAADVELTRLDAELSQKGHVAAKGTDDKGEQRVVGFSSGSKVWSSRRGDLKEFVIWTDQMAKHIGGTKKAKTGTRLDLIPTGERALTANLHRFLFVAWNESVFLEPVLVCSTPRVLLSDTALVLDPSKSTPKVLRFWHLFDDKRFGKFDYDVRFGRWDLVKGKGFALARRNEFTAWSTVVEYLNANQPVLHFTDGTTIHGTTRVPGDLDVPLWTRKDCTVVDWTDVDIRLEDTPRKRQPTGRPILWHMGLVLHDRAVAGEFDLVFYDQGAGEIADFVTVSIADDVRVKFWHCKASSKEKPGARVSDFYELLGQAHKSLVHVRFPWKFRESLKDQFDDKKVIYINPKLTGFDELAERVGDGPLKVGMALVQPGLSATKVNASENIARLLGGAENVLRRQVADLDLSVICSA